MQPSSHSVLLCIALAASLASGGLASGAGGLASGAGNNTAAATIPAAVDGGAAVDNGTVTGPGNSSRHSFCRRGHARKPLHEKWTCVCSWPWEPTTNPWEEPDCQLPTCEHGNYSFEDAKCACHSGWRHAGITNPLGFFEGRCAQYQCQTHSMCEELLGIPGATCPIAGWNCDCGFFQAAFGTPRAQCMYPWWALASKATKTFAAVLRALWIVALVVAAVLLPFGKNVAGTADAYSLELFQHDLAWSIFAAKLGLWLYAFSTVLYFSFALLWISAIVALIVVALLAALALACLMACAALAGEGGGGGACEFKDLCACDCNLAECGACEGAECFGAGGSECCFCCGGGAAEADLGPAVLYSYEPCCLYGPYPYFGGPMPGTTCDCDCCGCTSCRGCTLSWQRCGSFFAWLPCLWRLVALAPRLPENMLGGVAGFLLGTHPLRNRHDQSSGLALLLARPCWSLSNRGDRWRRTVYEWLHERDAFEAVAQTGLTVAEARPEAGSTRVLYGGVAVEREAGVFSSSDRIFNFEDYDKNECWICQQGATQWDLWTSCRHAFCERCSGEMLRRQMPCPLCRVRSGRVLRRATRAANLGGEVLGAPQELEREHLMESEIHAGGDSSSPSIGGQSRSRAMPPAPVVMTTSAPPPRDGSEGTGWRHRLE